MNFFIFLFLLALCAYAVLAGPLQIKRQTMPKHEKQLVPWQVPRKPEPLAFERIESPSAAPEVLDIRNKLMAWMSRASGRKDKQMYAFSDYSDQSAGSSPAVSSYAQTPTPSYGRTPVSRYQTPYNTWDGPNNGEIGSAIQQSSSRCAKRLKPFLGSIFLPNASPSYTHTPSPLSDASKHFQNQQQNGNKALATKEIRPNGQEIVPIDYDHGQNSNQFNQDNNQQHNNNREIVELDHYDGIEGVHETNFSGGQNHGAQLRRSFSDGWSKQQQLPHKTKKGLRRTASDAALQKCGMMPKLDDIRSLSDKMVRYTKQTRLNMSLWKKRFWGTISGLHLLNARQSFKKLVEHMHFHGHNNNDSAEQRLRNGGYHGQQQKASNGGNLLLRDHPEEEQQDEQSPTKAPWHTNPFAGKTPSFKKNRTPN